MLQTADVQPPPTDEITAREAMVILGFTHTSTITRYVAERKLTPSRKLPGRTGAFLFWRHDILRLRDQRAAEATEATA